MTEERLKEIKDGIDFQNEIIYLKSLGNNAQQLINEELELYNEVVRLRKENEELKQDIEYWKNRYDNLLKMSNLE